jgi:hypothetical protein
VSIPKRTIKITTQSGKVFYESSQMDIFSDAKDTYTVRHDQQVIFRNPPNNTKKRSDDNLLQTSLYWEKDFIDDCWASLYRDTTGQGKKLAWVEVTAKPKGKQERNVDKITFFFNQTSGFLEMQVIEYTEISGIKSQMIVYKTIDLDSKAARECVYDTGGVACLKSTKVMP